MPTHRPDPSRRTVVRGIAWSVPVVTAVAAAPAFAASCQKTALQSVTWSSTRTTTAQTGTTPSGTNVNVTASFTSTLLGAGSLNTANLSASTVVAANDAISLVNNSPTTLAVDGNLNHQTANLVFTRPVYGLTFYLDDIDRATGSYADQVALTATPAEIPAATPGSAIAGAGTLADPWRTTGGQGDNAANQTVGVTYADGLVGMTSLSIRFGSPLVPAASAVHVVRIRQMQFRTCV